MAIIGLKFIYLIELKNLVMLIIFNENARIFKKSVLFASKILKYKKYGPH